MTETTKSSNDLLAAGQAQHAAKCLEAKSKFSHSVVFNAKRWAENQGSSWKSIGHTKLVHFIRHGQGYHNLLGEVARYYGAEYSETGDYDLAVKENCPYMLPAILDPPLTAVGREDAKKLYAQKSKIHPELFIASPMKRATQTILIGFREELNDHSIKMIAHEGCREQCGVFLCDKRSNLADYKEEFPRVDYQLMEGSEEDGIWKEKQRETMLEMSYRAHAFLEWIFEREEQEIVVGTHSAWLMALYNVVLDLDSEHMDMKTMFATGEMRSTIITRNVVEKKARTC